MRDYGVKSFITMAIRPVLLVSYLTMWICKGSTRVSAPHVSRPLTPKNETNLNSKSLISEHCSNGPGDFPEPSNMHGPIHFASRSMLFYWTTKLSSMWAFLMHSSYSGSTAPNSFHTHALWFFEILPYPTQSDSICPTKIRPHGRKRLALALFKIPQSTKCWTLIWFALELLDFIKVHIRITFVGHYTWEGTEILL